MSQFVLQQVVAACWPCLDGPGETNDAHLNDDCGYPFALRFCFCVSTLLLSFFHTGFRMDDGLFREYCCLDREEALHVAELMDVDGKWCFSRKTWRRKGLLRSISAKVLTWYASSHVLVFCFGVAVDAALYVQYPVASRLCSKWYHCSY